MQDYEDVFAQFGFQVENPNQYAVYLSMRDAAEGGPHTTNISISRPCEACGGKGKKGFFRCKVCDGRRHNTTDVIVCVHLPQNVKEGDILSFSVLDPAQAGLLPADMQITAKISPSSWDASARMMTDVFGYEMKESMFRPVWKEELFLTEEEARTGTKKEFTFAIPFTCPQCGGSGYLQAEPPAPCAACNTTGYGRGQQTETVQIKIPRNLKPGCVFRADKKGAFLPDGKRGDLVVDLIIK